MGERGKKGKKKREKRTRKLMKLLEKDTHSQAQGLGIVSEQHC